ncbi:MAG TPA: bifunctional metallophosphatase/5'-nucleotidase [Bacteroidales bacterium]|nr:bifunctional metallophosphatase/5'-nucleotidase [Bacteroidales bacterium]
MISRSLRPVCGFLLVVLLLVSCINQGSKHLSIVETTDIHGVILPYDYVEKEELNVSLASSFTYIKQLRKEKDAVVLLDNGDNLQGQPAVYYYNLVDTVSPHLLAEAMNYMEYDAVTVGNHDIETGHQVYDRLVKEYNFPLLAANAVNLATGKPYFKPYAIIKKSRLKIAVLGLVTPTIHNSLPKELYKGIEFRNMYETAKEWMPEIIKEKPDLIIGLFHTGWDNPKSDSYQPDTRPDEGSAEIAFNIPGFDIIFTGHDHRIANEKIVNISGDTVLILNGGSRSMNLAQADVTFERDKKGKFKKAVNGIIIKVADHKPDAGFIEKFNDNHNEVLSYVNEVLGSSSNTISSRDSYFGSSGFIDMMHSLQLDITGADISFAAPLSFDVKISEGPVTVGDMFKLYRFENMLYTMSMSGLEVEKYLEYSYAGWFNTVNGPDDYLLKLRTDKEGKLILTDGKAWLKNQAYNFDSAAGINYIVDVTKPEGSRITITGFSDGTLFEKNKIYKVAVNSYRGNGGGGHFYNGVGIDKNELMSRVMESTERDLRYYMIEKIRNKKTIDPLKLNNWKIIPEAVVNEVFEREYKLLFGEKK